MSVVDGKLCGLQKEELLRFLLSEKFFFGALLEQLDSEEVDGVEDLGLLDLERCFEQVTACKIRKALDSQEKGLYASESRASPAARDPSAEAATPPAHAQNTEEPQWLADAAAMLAPAGACPASPTRARPAAREDEVTPPAAPSKQAARRDLARRGVVRRVQFTDEGVVRPQAATRLQAAWRRWVAQHCYNRLRSWPTCGMRRRVAAEAIETAYAIPPGCCMPAGMRRALVRDHAARVVQNAYLLGVEQGSWGRVRRRRAWESRRVGEEIILSYWMRSSSATMDLGFLCFQEGFIEAVWRIQAVWRGTRVRAAAVGVAGRAPLRGFDAHAAGAFFAARWAAATAQGSTAVIYNAAPAEGDNKQAVPQARGDEKQSDAETAPQLRVARSEAGGDSDADAACLPKPTQSSPLPQPTSGRGRGQPAAGQTPLVARPSIPAQHECWLGSVAHLRDTRRRSRLPVGALRAARGVRRVASRRDGRGQLGWRGLSDRWDVLGLRAAVRRGLDQLDLLEALLRQHHRRAPPLRISAPGLCRLRMAGGAGVGGRGAQPHDAA